VTDPLADPTEAKREYGVDLVPLEYLTKLDGLVLAVPHRALGEGGWSRLCASLVPGGVFVDVKAVVARGKVPSGIHYWSL
jgi:UDP-N-acetyl-D-galactosamine dehydrogenase